MHYTPLARERRRPLTLLLLIGLGGPAACARQNEMAPRPAEPACRTTVTLDQAIGAPAAGRASGEMIRWYGPAAADMQRELARWCATVGPAVVQPTPSSALAEAAVVGSLRVLSWNGAVGGGDLVGLLNRELDLNCADGLPQPGERFSHFVLLLQEAHRLSENVPVPGPDARFPRRINPAIRPGPRLQITEVATRCGLALLYVPSARNGERAEGDRREDKGNAILASLPLSDFLAIELPLEASRKVAVGASVIVPSGDQLRVVSVHFDVAAGLARILSSGNSWRLEQAEALVEALRVAATPLGGQAGSDGNPATLVAGDFNVWTKDDSALRLLRRELPDSPAWTGQPTRGAFPPDHLFFKNAPHGRVELVPGSYRRIEERYYSDHHALAVRLITRG